MMKRLGSTLLVLMIGLAALMAAYYAYFMYTAQTKLAQNQLNTISREGIVTQIHELNRLETMAFHIDTVVKSGCVPAWNIVQPGHSPQASNRSSAFASHNRLWAIRLATCRFPTPGGPTNRKVLANRPRFKARRNRSNTSS